MSLPFGYAAYIAELERRNEDAAAIMDMALTAMERDEAIGEGSVVYGAIHGALDILLNANAFKPIDLEETQELPEGLQ